ncbi:class I SAM-dependent methyltransferase [Rhodohalobacter sulfatireducens]|uniref:Methyltransferase domain-containing protein n=1 Tax=Rhodohalobacter sulfatireducens TaxID=2911366 RepID=A0ABS9K7X1_9BACT|nr:methyltransferase domain-containing protein [Rhodohalobacter sulfatireducens]MCG2586940.1 methyltransferase domain-containing protein [Rhodohalobacter sulfatireducens]
MNSAAKNTVRYYDKLANRYDKQYQTYLNHTHEKLLDKIELSPEDEVLDCSAGTGLLAHEIMEKFGSFKRLVLNDPAPNMQERAKYRLRYAKDVEFTSHFTEELPFENETFTQIICLNSFHYYTDQDRVLKNFSRILKPGGTLWMLDWNRTGSFKIANKFIDWLSPENINSRTLPELKSLLADHEFDVVDEDTWGYRWWNFLFVRCEAV